MEATYLAMLIVTLVGIGGASLFVIYKLFAGQR